MKQIIKRILPLDVKYVLVDKKYIPLLDGMGCGCDNCGKPIANIATVKNDIGTVFNIGFDCLETILINNHLLSNRDVEEYQHVKKMIPKILRFAKIVKETIANNRNVNITGLKFEVHDNDSDFYPFYWLKNGQDTSRDNDYVKLKDVQFDFMLDTLRNIFPNLTIIKL